MDSIRYRYRGKKLRVRSRSFFISLVNCGCVISSIGYAYIPTTRGFCRVVMMLVAALLIPPKRFGLILVLEYLLLLFVIFLPPLSFF